MDSPFRKLFNIRSPAWPTKSADLSTSDAGMQAVPYESTTPSPKSPIFISQPLRRSMTEQISRSALQGLSIRAFSYDSVLPGKPPIIGGRPHRGNGPVKLQTSRRLSSGELLATSQDPRRTLEDILEGDYVVGGAKKRASRSSQVRSPTPSLSGSASCNNLPIQRNSPRLSLPSRQSSRGQSMSTLPDPGSPLERYNGRIQYLQPHASLPNMHDQSRSNPSWSRSLQGLAIDNVQTGSPYRMRELSSRKQPSSSPLISTEILKRAEKMHIASLGTVNEAADGEVQPSNMPSPDSSTTASGLQTPLASQSLSFSPQDDHNTVGSHERHTSFIDDSSDCSSHNRSSLRSSEASSAYTGNTSIPDDPADTREQVHRLVDSVRSNYLKAIEEQSRKGATETVLDAHTASDPVSSLQEKKGKSKEDKSSTRQSWYSSDVTASELMSAWRWTSDPKESSDVQAEPSTESVEDNAEDDSLPSLQRADSMTLGSILTSSTSNDRRAERRNARRAVAV